MSLVIINQNRDKLITERGVIYYRAYDKALIYLPHTQGSSASGIELGHYDTYEDAKKAIGHLNRFIGSVAVPTKEDVKLCR